MQARRRKQRRRTILFEWPQDLAAFLEKLGVSNAKELVDKLIDEAMYTADAIPGLYKVVFEDGSAYLVAVGGEYTLCGGPACVLAVENLPSDNLNLNFVCEREPGKKDTLLWLNGELVATCDRDCSYCIGKRLAPQEKWNE